MMELTIDRFGRVVLPKKVREDLDLEAGSVLVVEEVKEGILLKPLRDQPSLITRDGVLVFVGKSVDNVGDTVQELRANRLKALSDWKRQRRR